MQRCHVYVLGTLGLLGIVARYHVAGTRVEICKAWRMVSPYLKQASKLVGLLLTILRTDLSKGSVLGQTITTDTRTGNLVVALLAVLSTIGMTFKRDEFL